MLKQNQTSLDCSTCKEIEETSLQNTAALKGHVSFQVPPYSRLASWRTRARVTPWRSITKDLSSRWSEVSNYGGGEGDWQCIVRLEQCVPCTVRKLNSKQCHNVSSRKRCTKEVCTKPFKNLRPCDQISSNFSDKIDEILQTLPWKIAVRSSRHVQQFVFKGVSCVRRFLPLPATKKSTNLKTMIAYKRPIDHKWFLRKLPNL